MFGKRTLKKIYLIVGVIAPIMVLVIIGVFGPLRSTAEKIIYGQRPVNDCSSSCQLKEERQIAELKTKIASLTEENLSQRKLLSAPVPKNWQFTTVQVSRVGEEMTIQIGSEDGVQVGQTALFEDTYIGRISEVNLKTARIRLPSFFNEKLSIKIVSKDKSEILGKGLLIGKGAGRMIIEQIFSSEQVSVDDLVIIDREGGVLLVGKIKDVLWEKGEVFKSASVNLLYHPEEQRIVFLIRGKI